MKKFWQIFVLTIVLVFMFALAALGADPSPIPVGQPASINWTVVLGALGGLAAAVLDFIFAINSNAKSNGVLHWIYLALGGKETPPPKP